MSAAPPRSINLSAAAERLSWAEAQEIVRISTRLNGMMLEVRAMDGEADSRGSPAESDDIYIVISGFGLFWCGDDQSVECTAGDVLFAPKGCEHRFERGDAEIRVWRISLLAGA